MKFIKRYIKEIIICVLVLFGMSKCAQSCNRQIEIDAQHELITNKDSCINKQARMIDSLNRDIDEYGRRLDIYGDFVKERRRSDSINVEAQRAQAGAINQLANKIRNK